MKNEVDKVDTQRYTLKYDMIDDDNNTITKFTVFKTLENLLGFMINVTKLCETNNEMSVYNKETKKLIIRGSVWEILAYFKPEFSHKELIEYFNANLLYDNLVIGKN